jgi:hypothetical protein
VSTQQRENPKAILRQSAFPADIDAGEQRRLLRELTSAQPLPAEVTVTAAALGGVPVAEITVDRVETRHVVLYSHGGANVLGGASQAAALASQVGRRASRSVQSVRLQPGKGEERKCAGFGALPVSAALAVASWVWRRTTCRRPGWTGRLTARVSNAGAGAPAVASSYVGLAALTIPGFGLSITADCHRTRDIKGQFLPPHRI